MADHPDPPALPHVDPTGAADLPVDALTPELLAGLLADGDDELATWTLRQALAASTRAEVYDGLLAAAMRLVGDRWQNGRWSVAEEHLASQTLKRALDRVRPPLRPDAWSGPLAVLAAVAGEHHFIGLACLDHILREGGWTVAFLGADVPTEDLARYVARTDARLVALTASQTARTDVVSDAVSAVRKAHADRTPGGDLAIILGGGLANRPHIAATVGVDWAGVSLAEAAAFAATVAERLAPRADTAS